MSRRAISARPSRRAIERSAGRSRSTARPLVVAPVSRDGVRHFARLVTAAAARLVRVERADLHGRAGERRRPAVEEALGERRGAAAAVADGLQLVDVVGEAEELGHRPNGSPRKSCASPAATTRPPRSTSSDDLDDAVVEELHLVDPDRLVARRERRISADSTVTARIRADVPDDVADVVAVVDRASRSALEAGDLGAPQAADQLLALAAEHRPADDLEPAAAFGDVPDHGPDPAPRRTRPGVRCRDVSRADGGFAPGIGGLR